jgi:hypothetical protein
VKMGARRSESIRASTSYRLVHRRLWPCQQCRRERIITTTGFMARERGHPRPKSGPPLVQSLVLKKTCQVLADVPKNSRRALSRSLPAGKVLELQSRSIPSAPGSNRTIIETCVLARGL